MSLLYDTDTLLGMYLEKLITCHKGVCISMFNTIEKLLNQSAFLLTDEWIKKTW